jgi:hypothetical protein
MNRPCLNPTARSATGAAWRSAFGSVGAPGKRRAVLAGAPI